MNQTKICPKCPEGTPAKPISEFAKNRSRPDGLNYECKACHNKRMSDLVKGRAQGKPDLRRADPTTAAEARAAVGLPVADPVDAALTRDRERAQSKAREVERKAALSEVEKLRKENELLRLAGRSPEILVYKQAAWDRCDAIPCGVASDWHVEEPVDLKSVHGLNEFNLEIAKSRAEHFFRNFLRLAIMMARESKITTLHMSWLGDFFSGFIHDELVANNLLAPADAARFVNGLLSSGIEFLLRESSFKIVVDCIAGNHGRMTKTVWHGDPTGTSLESFMYHAVAARFENNPRVQIDVADQAMVYRHFFESFKMRLIHGYEVKFGGGVGGITIPLRKALAQWNNPIRADLTVLGHFHQLFDGGDFIVNGSLIGYNTFAQAIKASFEEARQAFFLIHARGGGQKSITAPIWLDDKHAKPEPAPKPWSDDPIQEARAAALCGLTIEQLRTGKRDHEFRPAPGALGAGALCLDCGTHHN